MENKEQIDLEEEWEDLSDTSIEEERAPPTSSSSSSSGRQGFGKALSDEDAYSETIPEKKKRGQTDSHAFEETVKKWPRKKQRSAGRRPKNLQGERDEGEQPPKNLQGEIDEGKQPPKNLQGEIDEGKLTPKNLQGEIDEGKQTPKNLQGEIDERKKPPKKRWRNLP